MVASFIPTVDKSKFSCFISPPGAAPHSLGTVRYLCLRGGGGAVFRVGGKIFKINEKGGLFF